MYKNIVFRVKFLVTVGTAKISIFIIINVIFIHCLCALFNVVDNFITW